jgi:hypothetical protein
MKPILALIPLLYAFVCLIDGELILINKVMAVVEEMSLLNSRKPGMAA